MLPEIAQGSARLLEALEKLAEWAGSGPGGNGPSGSPSEDVVRAFEQALAGPSEGAAAETAAVGGDTAPPDAAAMDVPSVPGPAQSVPPLERGGIRISEAGVPASEMPGGLSSPAGAEPVDFGPDRQPGAVRPPEAAASGGRTDVPDTQTVRAQSSEEETPVRELGRLLDEFSRPGANIGPDALFRAQYLAGMLKVQVHTYILFWRRRRRRDSNTVFDNGSAGLFPIDSEQGLLPLGSLGRICGGSAFGKSWGE